MNIIICDHCGNDMDNKISIIIRRLEYHLCDDCTDLILKHWLSSGQRARDMLKRMAREEK